MYISPVQGSVASALSSRGRETDPRNLAGLKWIWTWTCWLVWSPSQPSCRVESFCAKGFWPDDHLCEPSSAAHLFLVHLAPSNNFDANITSSLVSCNMQSQKEAAASAPTKPALPTREQKHAPASIRYPFWFGGSASSMAACVTHPLDLVKVRAPKSSPRLSSLFAPSSSD